MGHSFTMTTDVKATFSKDDSKRRFSLVTLTYQSLILELYRLFSIPRDQQLIVQYIDNEDDIVNMSSDDELLAAVRCSVNNILRLIFHIRPDATNQLHSHSEPTNINSTPYMGHEIPHHAPHHFSHHPHHPHHPHLHEPGHGHGFGRRGGCRRGGPPAHVPGFDRAQENHSPHPYEGGNRHGGRSRRGRNLENRGQCPRMQGKKRMAKFVRHVTIPDDSVVQPGVEMVKTWRFFNGSRQEWPSDCKLVFVGSSCDRFGHTGDFIDIVGQQTPQPGMEADISMTIRTPESPGLYTGYLRMSDADGNRFGERVRIQVVVTDQSSALEQLETMGFTNKTKNLQLLKQHQDVNRVLEILLEE